MLSQRVKFLASPKWLVKAIIKRVIIEGVLTLVEIEMAPVHMV